MPAHDLVIVVIPVFNGAAYLAEAVQSVLRQTHERTEIIIVDDGSTDATPDIASSMANDVRYVRQNNAGPAAALNRGIALAEGAFVSFLSADDVWVPEKLTWQLAAMALDTRLQLVFGHVQQFISPELDKTVVATLRCPPDPMPAYSAGSLLAKPEVFRTVGLFAEHFRVGEFIDWYGRALDLGLKIRMLPEVVSRRRIHRHNHSLSSRAPSNYPRILKATLDRRREERGDKQ